MRLTSLLCVALGMGMDMILLVSFLILLMGLILYQLPYRFLINFLCGKKYAFTVTYMAVLEFKPMLHRRIFHICMLLLFARLTKMIILQALQLTLVSLFFSKWSHYFNHCLLLLTAVRKMLALINVIDTFRGKQFCQIGQFGVSSLLELIPSDNEITVSERIMYQFPSFSGLHSKKYNDCIAALRSTSTLCCPLRLNSKARCL